MEENNFEKQVKEKMDELKILPSESVWEKVEMRIEKKKPRRILFFIVPLLCIFLAGGYWFYNAYYSARENYTKNKKDFKNDFKKNSELKNGDNTTKVNSFDSATVNETKKGFNTNTKTDLSSSKNYKLKVTNKRNLKSTFNSAEISTQTLATDKNEKTNDEKNDITEPFQPLQQKPEKSELTVLQNDSTVNNDISKKKSIVEKVKETDTSEAVAATIRKNKLNKNKWEAGFLFDGGISGVGNKFLGLQNTLPAFYQVSTGPGQFGPAPSKAKNSFAFIAGAFAQKNIFQKTKLSFGINFKMFNTTNEVGARNDSDKSISTGKGNVYHNHFGFIELPVELKFEIIDRRKFKLFWDAGFTVSQLLESNALQFNETTGYYFIDNSKFNKTKIGLSTGFAANIFQTRKTSLSIGPYFFYGLSKLSNEGLYDKKHFVFAGLRSEFLFRRK